MANSAVDIVETGEPPIKVALRRSARATRLTLRVPATGGPPVLTMPHRMKINVAIAFLDAKQEWLRGAITRLPALREIASDACIDVEGQALTIKIRPQRGVKREGDMLFLPARAPQSALRAWLRALARLRIIAAVDYYAAQIGLPVSKITLRDPRSRWGSCTSDGNIMLSWRLILAPPAVLNYVVAHEVAHLREMNHSAAFWAEVAALMPDYAQHQAWLKRHGVELHKYVFD